MRCLDGGEAVPGTAVKARPTTSSQALAHAGSDGSKANNSTAFSAALAEAAAEAADSIPQSSTADDTDSLATNSSKKTQHDSSFVSPSEAIPKPAALAEDSALAVQVNTCTASPAAEVLDEGMAGSAQTTCATEAACADNVPVAQEVSDPDCIGNPLYEDPDPVRPVPVAATELALQPASYPTLPSNIAPEAYTKSASPGEGARLFPKCTWCSTCILGYNQQSVGLLVVACSLSVRTTLSVVLVVMALGRISRSTEQAPWASMYLFLPSNIALFQRSMMLSKQIMRPVKVSTFVPRLG